MTQTAPPEVVQPRLIEGTGIHPSALDEDAVKVVARLRRKGHETFLVGGCVRDLLLRRQPKDFDVATSARPRQVKTLFRNCRVIGRRFKLAHLHFEDKILEVSTFRRRPEPDSEDSEDLLIRSDNAFGTANEDAHRRDFTINALFFDPESDCIHDYVGGLDDIKARTVRTIGDALVRIKEDPVRILRAIKFASRLSLRIENETWQAMCEAAGDLSRAAPPRLLEELQRLLRSGSATQAFQLMRDCGALAVLLPELTSWLDKADGPARLHFWRRLEALDSQVRRQVRSGASVCTPVLFGALLYDVFADDLARRSLDNPREAEIAKIAESVFGEVIKRLIFSRVEGGRLKRICVVQRRFDPQRSRRGFRPASFLKQDYFADALLLKKLRCIATEEGWDDYDRWVELSGGEARPPEIPAAKAKESTNGSAPKPKRASRGRRKKRGRGRERAEPLPPLPAIELDPSEIPTYGSVLGDKGAADKIQLEASKGKRTRKRERAQDEPYVPPPPPDPDAKRRGDDDDTFGDW